MDVEVLIYYLHQGANIFLDLFLKRDNSKCYIQNLI